MIRSSLVVDDSIRNEIQSMSESIRIYNILITHNNNEYTILNVSSIISCAFVDM